MAISILGGQLVDSSGRQGTELSQRGKTSFNPLNLRPTHIDIDLDIITENLRRLKAHVAPARVLGVVKANAYGHGMVPMAKHLEQIGVDAIGVAFLEEGIQLRSHGIKTPILIFGGIFGSQIQYFLEYDLEITASSVSKLEAINEVSKQLGKRAKVHLKIDTGLERIGVHYYNARTLFSAALRCSHCDIVGVFSHFAKGSDPDSSLTEIQLERFLSCLKFYEEQGLKVPLRHIANTGGTLQIKATHLDMVRVGMGLYGVYPKTHLKKYLSLEPALTLRSRVVYFKVVKKGASVSYGHSWTAPEDTRVITLPLGYGDGYSRALSNKGHVLIHGKRYPIVGNICMDQLMVNIGQDSAYNNDEVVLIGKQASEEITVSEIAEVSGLYPYEVLTSLNQRIPRRYHLGGQVYLDED